MPAITNELIQFTNCRLVRNHELVDDDLWIRNGKIINPEPLFYQEQVQADKRIDCGGAIIAAGFIDLQINGGYGVDFSFDVDTVEDGINKVARGLITNGVTSFCPTLVTSPAETYHKVLPRIPKTTEGAGILGVHLEGPFISPRKKGAHPEECIKAIDKGIETIRSTYGSVENVKIITLAPEEDVTCKTIAELTEMGITVALGHSMASLNEGENAIKCGARLITHLFNAMLPFHHRDPGLVGLLATDVLPPGETVYFSIIADGVHTHPAALRIALRTNPTGLILVTDAISALGLEEGIHHVGQLKLEVINGKAFLAGTKTLCGSIAPMDECVRTFKMATGCSTVFAIETATLHPAKCLKIEKFKGTLDFNSDADFVFLNDDLFVQSTWIAVTSPAETYHKVLPRIPKTTEGAGILGVHLEGPFISPRKKGAHPEECIKAIDKGIETIRSTYGSVENVKIITLAPEEDVTCKTIAELTEMGITVALGHSMASLNEGENAIKCGARLITHLFNAMLPFHHRDPGLVGLLATDVLPPGETVYFSIIADGVHTHPAALRIALRTNPTGLILVTDAISALGLEEGIHHVGQLKLEVINGKAFLAGTKTLCGSIAPMDECVRTFKMATGCSTVFAIETATLHPAKCLKIEKFKGTLDFNSDADFVFLNDDLFVQSTWIAGKCVFKQNKFV